MFAILTLISIAFIWTRPGYALGFVSKVIATGAVLSAGCCLGVCTGTG
jgi:hypothetical protein